MSEKKGYIDIRYVPDPYRTKELAIRIPLNEQLSRKLRALPRDREVMEEMSDKHPLAWMYHERYRKQEEERGRLIEYLSSAITKAVKEMIESQDPVNGYEPEKV